MDKLVIAKYIRLSLDEAHTGSYSIDNQRLLLNQYLTDAELDNNEVLEFVDNGYSGINFERPAVQELLELVRAGKVNCILVKDFSRFGRDALETGYFIEQVFPLFRVRFIAVSDGYDSLAHEGGAGGMEVAFKFLINEYYSRDLSVKLSSAKREKALRGEAVRKDCIFGYMLDDDRNMVIDPQTAKTVRLIFEMYAVNRSLTDISKCLYEQNCLSPAAHKKQCRAATKDAELACVWQKSVLLQMLRDEQYLGTYVAGKTRMAAVGSRKQVKNAKEDWIRIPGHHPAIISQNLFDAVQKQLNTKGEPLRKRNLTAEKRYAKQTSSALGGKVICGQCGHAMRISATKNAAFHCRFTLPAPDAACHKLRILKSELEKVVLKSMKRQAKIVIKAGLCANDIQKLCTPAADEYIGKIEKLRENQRLLYESLVLGSIGSDEYKNKKTIMDGNLTEALNVHAAILGENKKSVPDTDSLKAAKKALRANILSKTLVDMLIDKVLVYPKDRIEIVWKLSGFVSCMADAGSKGACYTEIEI